MNDKKKMTKEEIQEKIRKVDGAMAQEGMPLTEEIKKKLYNCITVKSTYDKERKKPLKSIGEFMDNKYKYTCERTSNYCYKGTDILINKLNITNDKYLLF